MPKAPALLAALAAALLVAGCGSVGLPEGGNTTNGETQFKAKCGSCHTLAAAGTTGTIGPNLDDAFAESKENGIGEETIAGVVRDQIAYPITKTATGAPGMPANLVTGQDADDVATYVASVAASGKAPTPPPTTGGGETGGTTTGGTTSGGTTTGATTTGGGGAAAGKSVFASAGCGSCHTLADAGASGTVGPNLDDAKPPKALVVERVTNGMGVMPSFKDRLSAAEIEAVATYVSSVAGK